MREPPRLSKKQDICYFRLRRMQRAHPGRSFTMEELCARISTVVDCRDQMIYRLRKKGLVMRVTHDHLNPRWKIVGRNFISPSGTKVTVNSL